MLLRPKARLRSLIDPNRPRRSKPLSSKRLKSRHTVMAVTSRRS